MKSDRDDITIDASGSSPEEDNGSLNRKMQDLQRLLATWIQPGPTSTRVLVQILSSPEFKTIIESITLQLEESSKQRQKCLKKLSDIGWYFSPDLPIGQLLRLADSLGVNDDCGNDAISSYLRERIDSIGRDLSESYPHRSQIFQDAFEAHRAGQYTLSVPVFLSQADGIWRERFHEHFFQISIRRKSLKEYENNLQHYKNNPQLYYVATMLTLLEPREKGENNPLWANERERSSSFYALNRHQVLHGESVDYATEQNSFKAIVLLDCFRGICRMVAQ